MALDVIRYTGDLKLATAKGGTITLDTGVNTGTVVITGSLNVLGNQTSVSSTNTNLQDNILLLNAGESNPYVSYGSAGIAIDRGGRDSTTSSARLLYIENTWTYYKYNGTVGTGIGTWQATVGNGAVQQGTALKASAILFDPTGVSDATTTTQRMVLLGAPASNQVLSVRGQLDYAALVTHNDDVPNKKYVDDKFADFAPITALTALELRQGNTYVTVSDDSVTGVPSKVTTYIDDVPTMLIQGSGITMQGLAVVNRTIRSTTVNTDLTLQTFGTGTTVVNNGIAVGVSPTPPQRSPGAVKIYTTSTLGAGSTGILFVADDNRTLPSTEVRGELISARKALVFSIIF